MARWLGIAPDPNSNIGGSTYDLLTESGPIEWPDPTVFLPATDGNSERNHEDTPRNDETTLGRGALPPVSYRADPGWSFSVPLYMPVARLVLPAAYGKVGTPVGTAPASISTPLSPVDYGARLPSLIIWLVRDGQLERHAGAWIEQLTLNTQGARPMLQVSGKSLFRDVDDAVDLPTPTRISAKDTLASVTFSAKTGEGSGTPIGCVTTFTLTHNNNFEADADARFCAGENVVTELVDGRYKRRQYPGQHILGEHTTTGTIGMAKPRVDIEGRTLLGTSERLVASLSGNPIDGATPAADESLVFDMPSWVVTGGEGAGALTKTGAIKATYDWGGFVDEETGADLTVSIVDETAVAQPA
ncbi:MAG: hypothetical protein ITG02_01205 [Patulibacter sp.]|nr:hypothetical protein [Patulibacter sp.]